MQNTSKSQWVAICAAVAVVVYMVFFHSPKNEIESSVDANTNQVATEEGSENLTANLQETNNQPKQIMEDVTELKVETLQAGTGATAEVGSIVTVHYVGALTDGTVFDSSIPRNQPFEFRLGEGSVIAGWEEGLKGMKVGEKRRLVIPPTMGYGSQGAGGVIPPNATLIFDVELLGVK